MVYGTRRDLHGGTFGPKFVSQDRANHITIKRGDFFWGTVTEMYGIDVYERLCISAASLVFHSPGCLSPVCFYY